MRQGTIAVVLGVALVLIVGALVLSRSPLRVVRVGARSEETLGSTTASAAVCQTGETFPAGASAVRIGLEASFGPRVLLRAYSASRLLTSGTRAAGWTGSSVTVPVKALTRAASGVKLCVSVPANSGLLKLYGTQVASPNAAVGRGGQALPGRVSVEYLAPGGGSWWSRARPVARHIGLGKALSGTWVALLVAALAAAISALVIGLAWRELS